MFLVVRIQVKDAHRVCPGTERRVHRLHVGGPQFRRNGAVTGMFPHPIERAAAFGSESNRLPETNSWRPAAGKLRAFSPPRAQCRARYTGITGDAAAIARTSCPSRTPGPKWPSIGSVWRKSTKAGAGAPLSKAFRLGSIDSPSRSSRHHLPDPAVCKALAAFRKITPAH